MMRFVLPLIPPLLLGLAICPFMPGAVRFIGLVGFGVLAAVWKFTRPTPRL
jgi:hypothetical protein